MISENIKKFRKENNMSQDELAEKLGVSRQSISLWETGQTQPTIDNIIALSKIFNVSTDAILDNVGSAKAVKKEPWIKKINTAWLIVILVIAVAIVVCSIFYITFSNNNPGSQLPVETIDSSTEEITESEKESESIETETETVTVTVTETSKPTQTEKATTTKTTEKVKTSETTKPQSTKTFDLFSYCKQFAIQKGKANGDYTMYQQPATRYGGYENEYFSISYWGDSNMVEFCLHCPLSDTQSINFYLRMRGGYNKKYEYLTSRYYRSDGTSIRSATGYINPAEFTDNYPLNCDSYQGSTDGQTEFMEESRVGMCDLIRCLKQFVKVEKMECDFSAFDFKHF